MEKFTESLYKNKLQDHINMKAKKNGKTMKNGSLIPKLDGRGAHQMHTKKYGNALIDDVE